VSGIAGPAASDARAWSASLRIVMEPPRDNPRRRPSGTGYMRLVHIRRPPPLEFSADEPLPPFQALTTRGHNLVHRQNNLGLGRVVNHMAEARQYR
jgi:hypothetical protein